MSKLIAAVRLSLVSHPHVSLFARVAHFSPAGTTPEGRI